MPLALFSGKLTSGTKSQKAKTPKSQTDDQTASNLEAGNDGVYTMLKPLILLPFRPDPFSPFSLGPSIGFVGPGQGLVEHLSSQSLFKLIFESFLQRLHFF